MRLPAITLILIGITIFILYIVFLGVNVKELMRITFSSNPLYYMLALVLDTSFIVFYALAWYSIVKAICQEIRIKDAVMIVMVGWFGDMLIPTAFVTGEALRLYLLRKLYGVEYSKTFVTVVVHRLLSAIAFTIFVALGIIFLIEGGVLLSSDVVKQALFAVVLASIVIVLGLLVLFRTDVAGKIGLVMFNYLAKSLEKFRLERYRGKVLSVIRTYENSVDIIMEQPIRIFLGFIAMMIQWSIGVSIPYIFFRSVGYHMSFWALAAAYPIYGLADNLPIAVPANAGVLDVAMTSMFILLGAPKEIAATVTILTRSIIVLFEAILTGAVTALVASRFLGEFNIEFLKSLTKELSYANGK